MKQVIYKPGEVPYLYIDEWGSLAIGQGYVIDKFDEIEEMKYLARRALTDYEVHNFKVPVAKIAKVIPQDYIDRLMHNPMIKDLYDLVARFPFQEGALVRFHKDEEMKFCVWPISRDKIHKMIREKFNFLLRRAIVIQARRILNPKYRFEPPEKELWDHAPPLEDYSELVLLHEDIYSIGIHCSPNLMKEAKCLVLNFIPGKGAFKAVADVMLMKEFFSDKPAQKSLLSRLLPLEKFFEKTKEVGKFYRLVKQSHRVKKRTDQLIRGETKGCNYTSRINGVLHRRNIPYGVQGTFLTDQKHVEDAIGKLDSAKTSIELTPEQAERLAENLGIPYEAVMAGGTLSVIDRIEQRMPRTPKGGNSWYRGHVVGLPGGGPEVEIDPINNTSTEPAIRQIDVSVYPTASNSWKKYISRERRKAIRKHIHKR